MPGSSGGVSQLTVDEIQSVFQEAFETDARVRDIREYPDGWFAAVYGAGLADGRELVLKAAPPRELSLLRHEVDLAHTEIEFYRKTDGAGIPVPVVRFADRGYLIIDKLRGRSLEQVKHEMTEAQQRTIRRDVCPLPHRTPWSKTAFRRPPR